MLAKTGLETDEHLKCRTFPLDYLRHLVEAIFQHAPFPNEEKEIQYPIAILYLGISKHMFPPNSTFVEDTG